MDVVQYRAIIDTAVNNFLPLLQMSSGPILRMKLRSRFAITQVAQLHK